MVEKRSVDKKVFLVAAFPSEGRSTEDGPLTGMAEDVVAVIGMAGSRQRFEWVGMDQHDSVSNPALVTPVKVRLALPSPWHDDSEEMVTGLVQLAPTQLGGGTIDDDVDHLLSELSKSRHADPEEIAPDRAHRPADDSEAQTSNQAPPGLADSV